MSDPDSADDPVRFSTGMTIDPGFAGRMVWGGARAALTRPITIVRLLLTFIVAAAIVAIVFRDNAVLAWVGFIMVLLLCPVVTAISLLIGSVRARRRITERMPVGSHYTVVLRDRTMRFSNAVASSEVAYSLYRGLRVLPHVVGILPRRGRGMVLLPRDAFSPESLTWLGARLAAENAPAGPLR